MLEFTTVDQASPELRKLMLGIQDRKPLLSRLGMEAAVFLRAHFTLREGEPNRRGWPKPSSFLASIILLDIIPKFLKPSHFLCTDHNTTVKHQPRSFITALRAPNQPKSFHATA
jgi:hypothetical protein